LITRAGALLVQLEVPLPTVEAAVDMAARYGALVILNPAPVQRLPPRLLRRTDWLTPNRVEAEQLAAVRITDDVDAAVAAKKLLKTGVGGVCLTLGEGGALLVTKNRIERVPGFKVKAIDTTAAGDVFNGVFALGLVEGRSAFEAARFANAAAALSVTRVGAQCSMPRRHDVERWLRRYSSRVLKWERI
jgi:ribokinase